MFKPHKGQCIDCPTGTESMIVVKAGRCGYHNHIKKGKPLFRTMQKSKLNPISSKEKKNITKKKNMYREFDEKMKAEGRIFCTGCGCLNHLSHSHLVPVSFNKKLESVIENITYHCSFKTDEMSCHEIYETHDVEMIILLKDWEINLEKIRKLDKTYYQILMNKVNKISEFIL